MRTLVWFRGKDLRVADHAPLRDAIGGGEVVPLFVLDPYFFAPERAGELPHRIQFLLDSLRELEATIERLGSRLIIISGKSVDVIPQVAQRWRVDRVAAHRWTEPFGRERDRRIADQLDVPFELYEGELLHPPGRIRTGSDKPYSVFTPFSRAFRKAANVEKPLRAPRSLPPLPDDVRTRSETIPSMDALGLQRNDSILEGGETASRKRLKRFMSGAASKYDEQRDRMDVAGTSRLSADIKFGTLSIRTVWRTVNDAVGRTKAGRAFLNELIWREFAYNTLWDRPQLLEKPFRPKWEGFPWRFDEGMWQAWTEGQTGYPIVDASARQLLGEGFVHNRARMISASFLTKHLLIDYRLGEAHYLKYLTDGDWASNNAGWQWSTGCGCDAQPYFRVFNPVTQGKKFDPDGDYVRRWVPELRDVPTRHIHEPWKAPPSLLEVDYPQPIVDHREARERFLDLASKYLKG